MKLFLYKSAEVHIFVSAKLFNCYLVLTRLFMKLRKIKIVDKEFLTLHLKKQDSPTSTSETGENAYPLVFISSFVSYEICICLQY